MPDYVDLKKDELLKAATGFEENEDWANENAELFLDYSANRQPWYKDRVENVNFYNNIHYDAAEEAAIEERGQNPVAINIVYAIIKQIIALLTSSDPVWDVDPVGDTDKNYAYTMRSLLNASWYNSRGGRRFTQICKDASVVGVGFGMVNPTSNPNFGVEFRNVPYSQVYPFPGINELDYSDAESLIVSKRISVKQAAKFLGKSVADIIEFAKGEEMSMQGNEEEDDEVYPRYMSPVVISGDDDKDSKTTRSVRLVQRLELERKKLYIVKPKGKGILGRKIYFDLTDDLRLRRAAGTIEITEVEKEVLAKYISLGTYGRRYYIPISRYNLVPFVNEFNNNPYPLGDVDFLYGVQRALNRFVLLAILNATLSNNMKLMAVEGTVDKDKYEQQYAQAGVLVEYKWEKDQPPPQEMKPGQLSSNWLEFPQTLIHIMEYISGIFGVNQGNPEGAPRTASGLMSLQNYGGQKVKLLGRSIQDSLSSLGDVAIELYQNYAPYNGITSYYNESISDTEVVRYNQTKVTAEQIVVENDLSIGQFKTRCTVLQNYGSERDMKAAMLVNLAAQTRSVALIKPILKLADIPEADEILKEMDEMAKANATIQQLQQNLQRMQQINNQLQNEVLQKSQKVSMAQFDAKLDKVLNAIKSQLGESVTTEVAKVREDAAQLQRDGQDNG